jgi:DNA-binding transcriptional LysR family regulator
VLVDGGTVVSVPIAGEAALPDEKRTDAAAVDLSPPQPAGLREAPVRRPAESRDGTSRTFRGAVSDVDLRLLKVFRTVVEHGGFGPAEVVLDKSKSAISLDISGLEQRLGATLCTRGRGGFALTAEGHAVYAAARQLFDDLAAFGDRVATATGRLGGSVTVFLVDNIVSIAAGPIATALGAFARRHPRVSLTLESATPGGVEAAVLDGRADFGVSVLPRALAELETVPLFREELLVYCGRGHPLFGAAAAAAEGARAATVGAPSAVGGAPSAVGSSAAAVSVAADNPAQGDPALAADAVRAHALVKPSVTDDPAFAAMVDGFPLTASASNLDARVLLVLSGAFLGFLPPHYAEAWVARGELAAVRPDLFHAENAFQLITRRAAPHSAAARALRREMLAAFGEG